MNIDKIIHKFESKDSHQLWEATWDILYCNHIDKLSQLKLHIPRFRKILDSVKMGGVLHKNKDHALRALQYIEDRCSGLCRCSLYQENCIFNPVKEEERGFITIQSARIIKEKYEQHFDITCHTCTKKYKVIEVHGWHVPWYKWSDV